MNVQQIKENRLYFIKDEFFSRVSDPYLKINKAVTARPHFYAFRDPDTALLWMIPCSRQIEKFERIISEKERLHKRHNHIQIIPVNGIRQVFLYQDMFPVLPDYIEKTYSNRYGIFEIKDKKAIERIQKNARQIIKLLRLGIKFTPTQPDVLRIEKIMLEDSLPEINHKVRKKAEIER